MAQQLFIRWVIVVSIFIYTKTFNHEVTNLYQFQVNMDLYFTISELCIIDDDLPQKVADKLLRYHIEPMCHVRDSLGSAIYASQNSGYRPVSYEKKKGRSGNSEHCFKGKGAVDWRADNMKKLIKLIIEQTDYTRICFYPDKGFVHCDYKANDGKRYYYESDNQNNWTFIKYI